MGHDFTNKPELDTHFTVSVMENATLISLLSLISIFDVEEIQKQTKPKQKHLLTQILLSPTVAFSILGDQY